MTTSSADFQWMRTALDHLYANMSDKLARELLYDEAERKVAFASLRTSLLSGSLPQAIPDGELGDNLFQALLAIRIKFAPDEGRQKVELNIAMRQRPK
jgi:hypothetical protein